ncbi:E3 ubiquitin-protein ligase mind-bomb-like isoform X3 [Plutella xylostella]|uniref:E3 ubiquitin-protein ligase mind-bomb-like isoform X3 n=1 Tax=Plutella xylostella TaxID=51655 RepID=UPI0020324EB0|nr:E3 ubiquitin-protein ligase mind-bomb-like isoform X3 [Plutella xylostella]
MLKLQGYTAMHWACKRGHEDLVKLLAGAVRNIVNARSNGGYTPLHLAMQYRHENIYKLLVDVYDADPNMLDWSGKKAKQYLKPMDTSLSPGSYRKKEGFLRIGSLNVRVKKTTEAFSNFLGVGATRASAYVPKGRADDRRVSEDLDHLHKSWGSADSIAKDDKLMLPPLSTKVRRRGASGRKGLAAAHSRSTPSTPDQPRAQMGAGETGDSDSDSAAGFHSAWRQQRASDCL